MLTNSNISFVFLPENDSIFLTTKHMFRGRSKKFVGKSLDKAVPDMTYNVFGGTLNIAQLNSG